MSCCISAGGIVRIVVGGAVYPVRGNVTINATEIERTEGANLDGSIYVTSKPVPPSVEVTLSDTCGLSLQDLMNVRCQDVSVEMPEVGRTMILTNGIITGRPTLNPETGEISNVKFVGSRMREILETVV